MSSKYLVIIPDGMADHPIDALDGRTPVEAADTPNMDLLAKRGIVGRVCNIPTGMDPGSDVAIMSVLGFDPSKYHTGRAPLEVPALGFDLKPGQIAFRMNFVTIINDKMHDFSAGHISTKEAAILLNDLKKNIGSKEFRFYKGDAYRHLMVTPLGKLSEIICTPPHDIMGQAVANYLPKGALKGKLIDLMSQARKVLNNHEINLKREKTGKNPANGIWLWGQGSSCQLPSFKETFGMDGAMISAVPLLKSLGILLKLKPIPVEGITGYLDTNYKGKGEAAVKALKQSDFVCVHIEAPDEAGHLGDWQKKITTIERIDKDIVGTILPVINCNDNLRILILPDHPTPVSLRTHTCDPVPFLMCGTGIEPDKINKLGESVAGTSTLFFKNGHELMAYFLGIVKD
jgi:2,3-bisphosphoglycerate-independent phosphoglycerate mutase